jgi:hypothetical protein
MSEEAVKPFSSINRLFQSSEEAGRTSGTMFLLKNGPDLTDEVRIITRELMDGGDEMIFIQGLRERLKGRIGRMINGLIHANTEDAGLYHPLEVCIWKNMYTWEMGGGLGWVVTTSGSVI